MKLTRHLNSVFSHGSGYERTPVGRHFHGETDGYYIDFSAKTMATEAATPHVLGPAALAQLALGWWERLLEGDPAAGERFRDACDMLERSSRLEGDARIWRYTVRVPKYDLRSPWISALAQAQAASVFVRAFSNGKDARHRQLAQAAILPLVQETMPTVIARIDSGKALEECPTSPPSLILNGWIYALWGLRDAALGLESEPANRMYSESLQALLSVLPLYDTGWWSRYSLYPHRFPDLAKIFYHRLHVDQLDVMNRITGEALFRETADRWRTYDRGTHRVAAVLQKAVFVASRYR